MMLLEIVRRSPVVESILSSAKDSVADTTDGPAETVFERKTPPVSFSQIPPHHTKPSPTQNKQNIFVT